MEKGNGERMALSLLTPLQMEKYPHFYQMLKSLFEEKLTLDYIKTSLATEKQEVLKTYHKAEKDYNSVKLVHDCIWEIIAESNPKDKDVMALKSAFISSELNESMKLVKPKTSASGEDKVLHMFGLEIKKEPFDDDLQPWLLEQLKNKLIEKGIEQLELMGQDVDGNNQHLIIAKIKQLPSLISSQLDESNNKKKAQFEESLALREAHSKYMSTLLESLKIMEEILQKHVMEIQMEQYSNQSQWLQIQCDALLLKIKSLNLEIMCETYTKDTVPALRKILKDLEARSEQVESETQAARARISRYESVGHDFNEIVKEYSQLREAIKSKKWTLEKLKSYCPTSK